MTLLETVLYIGVFMVAMPMLVSFIVQVHRQSNLFDTRTRMEQTAGLVFADLADLVTSADAVRVSTSTLAANPSTLRLTDADGALVVVDCPTVAVDFAGTTQQVRRLRMQVGANPAVYITDNDLDVTEWQVTAIRDSAGVLTGLRVNMDFAMVNPTGDAYRSATFAADTTLPLSPHTTEQ